ncbi:MAG: protein kinase domain-containing protein [Gaiellaceae bacterium]
MAHEQTQAGELVLGRYRPLSPLGSGGSGSVWLARDERDGGEVALKIVLREGKAGPRAEREVAAAARLSHRRCLRTLDFASDDGHVYIAYEYVSGKTMRQAVRDGELDDRRALEACVQILEALAHAHEQGIVHRDVKPANVLLAAGERVDVRLLDFGLAQLDEAETLTALGDVPGTLAYIAPERLAGEAATPAADVWAVGVILWEMLAGWHPFWNGSLLETARRIEEGAPPLSTLRPDLPRVLLGAIERMLCRDPERRPAAAALVEELRAALRPRRASRPARRAGPTLRLRPKRLGHALLAAIMIGWATSVLPFYPAQTPLLLALLAAMLCLTAPRAGTGFVLLALLLPLGNVSLGLALVFLACAALWFALFWHEPEAALTPALGALAAPLGLLVLVPLALQPLRSPLRRAGATVMAVMLAIVAAGVAGQPLPLSHAAAPQLDIAGTRHPLVVAWALVGAARQQAPLLGLALLLAGVAVVIPKARRQGRWGIALLAGGLLVFGLLPFPAIAAMPLIAGAWLTAAVLAIASLQGEPQIPALRRETDPARHSMAA